MLKEILEKYKSSDHTYITVPIEYEYNAARTLANTHFKTRLSMLESGFGYVKGDTLYFDKKSRTKKVWVFWRKTSSEM